jgi:hypothetical protein
MQANAASGQIKRPDMSGLRENKMVLNNGPGHYSFMNFRVRLVPSCTVTWMK